MFKIIDNMENLKEKKTLFTGITPTGSLTIGHYLGVIKNLISFQKDYEIIVMIADLHALTNDYQNKKKINYRQKSKEIASTLYACGLDSEKCKVFIQSEVSEHLELSYLLSSYCSVGKLKNMTQYKEKLKKNKDSCFSLFYYPILMASDIFLYDVDLVVVGKDQKQHLEFAKYIANKFNINNENFLKVPDFFIAKKGSKIMSLKNPSKKMSKSDSDNICLLENSLSVNKKVMKSKTDSENKIFFDEKNKPGVSNLLTIYSCLLDIEIIDSEIIFKEKDYSFLKRVVAKEINSNLERIQKKISFFSEKIEIILSNNLNHFKEKASKKVSFIKKIISI